MAEKTSSALELAQQWLAWDREVVTREEVERLLADENQSCLDLLMRPRIAFGTAGLRGRMQAGFHNMNSLTVIQASQGLAAYLLKEQPEAASKGVVIGHDHRHNSAKFADLTAAAFIANGIKVHWLERMVHTPLVPFTVETLGAVGGVMITASHNPAQDNGYKVYWSNACQIIPPHDRGIAVAIKENLKPVSWDREARKTSALVRNVLDRVEPPYYTTVAAMLGPKHGLYPTVFTAMHGIGTHYLTETMRHTTTPTPNALDTSRHLTLDSVLIPVASQTQPDPDFPTTPYPNPEEPHALDAAITCAEAYHASSFPGNPCPTSIIALDPDADRFAAVERLPSGHWHQFTGNEVGVLFASFVLDVLVPRAREAGEKRPLAMLTTTVSSGMLARMAEDHGFRCVETLTGFKWLGNVGQRLEKDGYWVPYAFEEAIGYMFPAIGWDKDGVAAAAVWCAARVHWHETHNQTPYTHLQSLYARHGHHATTNTYIRTPSVSVTVQLFDAIRVSGPNGGIPTTVGNRRMVKDHDLTNSIKHTSPPSSSNAEEEDKYALPSDPATQMILIHLLNEATGIKTRMTVRASGTESKIKLYVESAVEPSRGAPGGAASKERLDGVGERVKVQKEADEVAEALKREWFGALA